jgi:hypothetical protein
MLSKKDRGFYIVVFIVTTALISMITTEVYLRVRYGGCIEKTYLNSKEAVEAIEKLDSLYNERIRQGSDKDS